jgi:hypothetical protein
VTVADAADLTRDSFELISWWPPGQQMAFCALRQAGVPFDRALRGLVIGAWIIGLVAWAAYFVRVLGLTEAAAWAIGLFALFRQGHEGVLVFSGGESLLWALCPVVVLVNLRALEARRARGGPDGLAPLAWALFAGATAVLLVVIKYSASFMTVGLSAAWLWSFWRRDVRMRQLVAWSAGAAIGVSLALAAGLAVTVAGGTPASSIDHNPLPLVALWVTAGPIVGLSNTLSAMQTLSATFHLHVLRFDRDAPEQRALAVAAIAWIVLLGIWARVTRPAVASTARWVSDARLPPWRIAASIAVVTSVGLGILLARGGVISFEDRHLQYAGFLLLPFLVNALARGWALRHVASRAIVSTMAVMAIGLPAADGAASLVSQAFVRSPDATRSGGLRIDSVIASDLNAQPWVATALLATPTGTLPLSRPGQRLRWIYADDWMGAVYRGVPAGGIALLVPTKVSEEYRVKLQHVFRDIQTWERVPLDRSTTVQLWRGH